MCAIGTPLSNVRVRLAIEIRRVGGDRRHARCRRRRLSAFAKWRRTARDHEIDTSVQVEANGCFEVHSARITYRKFRGKSGKSCMKKKIALIFPWAILFIAGLKIVAIVSTTPLIAYANNWDFAREFACYGVWEKYPGGKDKTESNFQAPVNPLKYDGDRRPEWCFHAIDNVFVRTVLAFHDGGDDVDLREVGAARVAFLLAMATWLMFLARTLTQRMLISISFLLVFGDIAYLSFFNTLYAEFSMLAGGLFSVFGLMLLAADEKARRGVVAFSAISLLFFGLSKAQYMPLAVVFGLVMAAVVLLKHSARLAAALFTALAIGMPTGLAKVNASNNGVMSTITVANMMDTLMVAVLPNTRDPKASLRKVGLPDHCARALGVSWYDPGVANNLPCPEIAHTSRTQLIWLFLYDATAFFNPMSLAIQKVRPVQIDNLGIAESDLIANSKRLAIASESSATKVIDSLSMPAFFMVVLGSIAAAAFAAFQAFRSSTALLVAAGGGIVFYALISSVFGDGFMEISKHATALSMGLFIQVCAIALLLGRKT